MTRFQKMPPGDSNIAGQDCIILANVAIAQHYWKYVLSLHSDSKNMALTCLHVKRYEIDCATEVYYSFTSCHGTGHMMDSTI